MKFGLEQILDAVERLIERGLPHQDTVVIGDNSSGKSLFLKKFIEKAKIHQNVYFVDAVNRGFDVKKISKSTIKPAYKRTILETRLKEDYFNLQDSFNCFGTFTERAESIYSIYEEKVQNLFYKLTGERFDILYGDPLGEVGFENGKGLLASGYQAIIRILLELLFYQDVAISQNKGEESWIVIDELDEFLSPKYAARILEFLKEEFSWAHWLITSHSCDLVAHTLHANLIILEDGSCEVLDIDDYSSVSEAQILFERVFGKEMSEEDEVDNMLRLLFNNKMNYVWGAFEEECFRSLQKTSLSASQQLIVRQIQEW